MRRGTVVRALRDLDPQGAAVHEGDLGVVFGEADCYGDGAGPIVRWFRVLRELPPCRVGLGGVCNVYDGDVEVIQEPD